MKILIAGAFGYGNLGDDAVRDSQINFFQSHGHEVVWDSPELSLDKFDGVDAVIVGGGGLLYDGDLANVENYTQYLQIAKDRGLKTGVCNIGTQGINTNNGKEVYRKILNQVDVISVRDPEDKVLLEQIGVTNDIFIGEDSAWCLPALQSMYHLPITKYGVACRTLQNTTDKPNKYVTNYEKTIERFIDDTNANVYCFSRADDEKWLTSFTTPHLFDTIDRLRPYLNTELLICSRYHAIITAISLGITPVLITGGEHELTKIRKIGKRLHGIGSIYWRSDTFERDFRNMIMNTPTLSEASLRDIKQEYTARAQKGMEWILDGIF